MDMQDYIFGSDVLGAGGPGYTDSATVLAVQRAIMALPQYKADDKLSLSPYGADGKWGPTTARAVERVNAYYRAGGAKDNDGPVITDGTLAALKLSSPLANLAAAAGGGAVTHAVDEALSRMPPAEPPAAPASPGAFPGMPRPAVASIVPAVPAAAPVNTATPTWKYGLIGAALLTIGIGLAALFRRK